MIVYINTVTKLNSEIYQYIELSLIIVQNILPNNTKILLTNTPSNNGCLIQYDYT